MDLLYYPVMVGAILLPGIWFLRRAGPLEALTLGAGFGILLWGAIGLARFFVILPPSGPRLVGLVSIVMCAALGALLALIARAGQSRIDRGRIHRRLLLAVVAVAALSLGIEASLPHYDLAERFYDWYMHFDLARFYETATDLGRHHGPATVTTRTPLYNLLGSVALSFLGDRFTVFQVLTAALAWLWILPFALLARRLVPRFTVGITALAGLSPLVLHTHTYAMPKGLVTFFALLALERFLSLRDAPADRVRSISFQFGLFSAAVVMSHNGFVGFPLALFCLYGWDVVQRRRQWIELGLASATGLALAAPWYAWAIVQFGLHAAVFGYQGVPYPSLFRWAFDRFLILPTSVLPLPLPLDRYVTQPLQTYFLIYVGTATGVLGLIFLFRALAQNLKPPIRFHAGPMEAPLLWFAAGGILVADVLHEAVLSNNAGTFCIPGLLALLLLAVRANPLSPVLVLASLLEMVIFEALVLIWVWSPAGSGRPNAEVAAQHHILFLGPETLPVGLGLVAIGIALALFCLWPALSAPAEVSTRLSQHTAA